MNSSFSRAANVLFLPGVIFMALLFLYPLLRMAAISTGFPDFSAESYARFFTIPSYVETLFRTFVASTIVTVACLVMGYPTAMFLAQTRGQKRSILLACVVLPYLTSLLVRTYAWMVILNDTSPLNTFLIWLGVIDQPLGLLFSTTGALIGMVHIMLPAMILPIYAILQGMDPAQMRAAKALGGGPARAFFKVYLPQSLPGIRSGATLVFALSLGFYITPAALGSPSDLMLSNLITAVLNSALDFRFASAIAIILLACTLSAYGVVGLFGTRSRHGGVLISRMLNPIVTALKKLVPSSGNDRTARRWAANVGREQGWEGTGSRLLAAYGYLVLFFLVLPSILVVVMSFSGERILNFPPRVWSLRWYEVLFTDPLWAEATWTSLRVAAVSTVMSMIIGGTAAYALVRGSAALRPGVFALMLAPMIVPSVVNSVGLYSVLAPWGLVNREVGLILALTPGSVSYVVIIMLATLTSFDQRLEMASSSLGAGRIRTALKIILPIVAPGAIAAALFAFIHAFDEVVISSFIAGSTMQTLPLKIWYGIQYELEPVIAAVSTLMMIFPIIALPFFGRRAKVLRT